MTLVSTDWTVTRADGNIRYTGDDHGGALPSYATVIELHRWLQDLADQESSGAGDDQVDITDVDPSKRDTDNIIRLLGSFNITAAEAEHLYDGTIIQGVGGTLKRWDGIVNYGNADVQVQIMQSGAVIADDWWNFAGGGLNPNPTQGISHRFMILVTDAGADIDGRRLIGTCRTFNNTYSEFLIAGTILGNNTLALVDAADLNNITTEAVVATWTGIDNTTEGYIGIDINDDLADEYYYSEWNRDTYTINQFYERMKWLTRDGSVSTLYGLSGEVFRGITHQIAVNNIAAGPFDPVEELTWTEGTTPSTGQLLAIDSVSAPTTIWIQLMTGIVPTDTTTLSGTTSGADCDVNTTVTSRTISKPFIGQTTGSAIIGAYGVGIEKLDLTSADKVFDLGDNPITPPNFVTFTVYGIESGDRVMVTNDQATGIDYDQLILSGIHASGSGTITVTTAIPTDTPAAGTIRVYNDDDEYMRLPYDSYTGSIFTLTGTTPTGASNLDNVFVSYVDKVTVTTSEAFTSVYLAPRTMFVRVREGTSGTPIKPAETTGSLGVAGGSATINRVDDF